MKTKILIVIFWLICSNGLAQETDSLDYGFKGELCMQIGAFYSPVLSKDFYGFNFDFKYYLKKRFATGLEISATQKEISDTFSYSIQKPVVEYYEFGWINHYDILQSRYLRIGVNLNNGLSLSRLGDNSEKETYYTDDGVAERAKEVATNYFYLIEPGIDVSVRLFEIRDFAGLYLTTKLKNRFVLGHHKYGHIQDFSNYFISVGISFIGL
jgi:hypothetical protein